MSTYLCTLRDMEKQAPLGDSQRYYFKFLAHPVERRSGTAHDVSFGMIAVITNTALACEPWRSMDEETVVKHLFASLRRDLAAGDVPIPGDSERWIYSSEQPFDFDPDDPFGDFEIRPRIGFRSATHSRIPKTLDT